MRKDPRPVIGLLSVFICFATLPALGASLDKGSSAENQARETILKFQRGVEAGDKAVGRELAAAEAASFFVPFYDLLADLYSRNRMAFPVEIGRIKILKDGRAKVETYLNPGRDLFVFTLTRESGRWKFSHMEGIRFPVYDVPALPASSVYEVPRAKVQWMMCERDVASMTRVLEALKAAIGPERARSFFVNQAAGFRVAMDAWLPFLEGAAQFALFYGILEENYYGSKYLVTKATEDESEIRFAPLQELEVMKIAHFSPKMTMEEYQALYRDIMRERARVCGLDLEVSFSGTDCTLRLRKARTKTS